MYGGRKTENICSCIIILAPFIEESLIHPIISPVISRFHGHGSVSELCILLHWFISFISMPVSHYFN